MNATAHRRKIWGLNLIYGWNGTGKTTISDIFRAMEKKHNHLDGEFSVETERGTLKSSDLGEDGWAALTPPIRVFNRDYVTANVFPPSNGEMAPIFYLGEESVGKQKQVESLKEEITILGQNLSGLRDDHRKKEAAVGELCVTGGQAVKLALLGSDSAYNNYDKRNFIKKLESMGSDPAPYILTEVQEIELKGRINGVVKGNIIDAPLDLPDLPLMKKRANDLIIRSVASEIIRALQADERLSHWVKEGLEIHKDHKHTDCQFCMQRLPAMRVITSLEVILEKPYLPHE